MNTNQEERPTPRTDALETLWNGAEGGDQKNIIADVILDSHESIERELAEVREQLREEQRLHVATLNERDAAREQRDRLQQWKDEAMAVEREWNPQEVGTLLGLTLGQAIHPRIEPGIRSLIAKRDDLTKALETAMHFVRHDLNCHARVPSSGLPCTCGMEAAEHLAKTALSNQ